MLLSSLAIFLYVFIVVSDLFSFVEVVGVGVGATIYLIATFMAMSGLLILWRVLPIKKSMPPIGYVLYVLFMLLSFFALLRGWVNARDYWDYKNLASSFLPAAIVPTAIVIGLNYERFGKTFGFIYKRYFLFGLVFLPLALSVESEIFARMMVAATFFLLLVPYVDMRWKLLIFLVLFLGLVLDVTYRANVFRVGISLLIVFLFLNRNLFCVWFLNVTVAVGFALPLFFLSVGLVTGVSVFSDNFFDFNVSAIGASSAAVSDLSADTRTFLYQEVFYSMIGRDSSFVFGEGAAAGYDTLAFADDAMNSRGRYAAEVGFLNVLMHAGVVGVALYAGVLFCATFYAINRSRNYFSKMLGVFLVGHWVLFFVEDVVKLDLNNLFIWIVIGLCFSTRFRLLSDDDVKIFFRLQQS